MMMLCMCSTVASLVNGGTELFISEAKQQRKSGLHLDWDNQSLLNRHQVGTEGKRYGFVCLNFGQKISGMSVVPTCSKFLPTNKSFENDPFNDVLAVTHRDFHKEDFLHDETLPNRPTIRFCPRIWP